VILVMLVSLAGSRAAAKGFALRDCSQVVATLEDPFARYGEEMGKLLLNMICKKMKELAPVFGVELRDSEMLSVFIPDDMKSFNKLTGRGLYTLAVYNSRRGIITQPAKTLKRLRRLGRLERTLTHELVHWFVDVTIGWRCPMWLNEGLAQWFEGLRPSGKLLITEEGIRALELRWHSGAVSLVQRSQDYLISVALTDRIIRRAGRDPLIQALKDLRGVRDIMDLEVNRHSIRELLFSAEIEPAPESASGAERSSTRGEPDVPVERGSDWDKQLAEEMEMLEERGGKVYDFEKYRHQQKAGEEEGVTPLPIKDMVKKAKKKK
jgi:hypothetical protein